MMPNFIWALEQCKGKYVALCDGDDYWTDPYKLQKQVDFLEKNPEYVITGHDVIFVDEHTKTIADSYLGREYKRDASSEELKLGFLIPTLSMVFRAKPVLNEYVEKASLVKNGDTFLTSLIGQYGKYNYMADVMGAYRKHQGGVWSMVNEFTQKRNNISTYTFLLSYYLQKGDVEIAKKIKERLSKDADALLFLAVKSGYSKFFREAYLYYFKTEIGFFDFSKLIYLNKCLLFFLKNRYFKRLNTDIDSGKLPL
jgi:glycosyltransferase involved in cell wall biosynthesis